jgi:hypothetical protein
MVVDAASGVEAPIDVRNGPVNAMSWVMNNSRRARC